MNRRLYKAFNALDLAKKNKDNLIPGVLGFILNGVETVDVPTRTGYVYVRLHNNMSELIQAYNDKVAPVYDLPVYVVRDDVDKTRYRIYGRDTGRYENWQTTSSYSPVHAGQHSFNVEGGGGGDIVWVYDRQFMPLLVYPSGSNGAELVMIYQDLIWHNSQWQAVGGTGTGSLLSYKPGTGSMGSLAYIYLDANGNPKVTGTASFDASVTGSSALSRYLPVVGANDIPLAMVRLVSGTSVILWDNIYDLRRLVY